MSTGYSDTLFHNHKERESLNVRHLGFGFKRCHFGNKMKHEAMENDRILLSLICCWRECTTVRPFWKTAWQFPTKIIQLYHAIQQPL